MEDRLLKEVDLLSAQTAWLLQTIMSSKNAASGEIHLTDGATYSIEAVLGDSPEKDLALLKMKSTSKEFRFLTIGDSDKVEVGQQVVAIGSPLGLEATVSPGFISGVREVNGLKLIQMTSPISPGSSGGVLIDSLGEVVGVPSQSLTLVRQNTTVSQNLNFAVPSNYVKELISAPAKEARSLSAVPARPNSKPPEQSTKDILKSAKTLCVSLISGNPVLKTELSGKLMEWGKLRLVSSPEEADLVLRVAQTGQLNLGTGEGNQATALLVDRATGTELWSKTKGGSWAMSGYSNTSVARELAKEFIKFFDSAQKKP